MRSFRALFSISQFEDSAVISHGVGIQSLKIQRAFGVLPGRITAKKKELKKYAMVRICRDFIRGIYLKYYFSSQSF